MMDPLKLLYLTPYLVSLAISLRIGLYALKRRQIAGAFALTVMAIGESTYIAGYILELLSITVAGKVFWDNFQFFGTLAFPTGLFLFGLEYTRQQNNHSRSTLALLLIPPTLAILAAYTDPLHSLIRSSTKIVAAPPFGELSYDYGIGVYVVAVFFYLFIGIGLFLLIRAVFTPHSIYRAQALTVLVGMLFPFVGSVLSVAGVTIGGHRDTAPFNFALSNIVVAVGLFRFALLDVVPIARNKVLENMPDALFVFDRKYRVIDLNPAARAAMVCLTNGFLARPLPKSCRNGQKL
jgi:hypothetical protein